MCGIESCVLVQVLASFLLVMYTDDFFCIEFCYPGRCGGRVQTFKPLFLRSCCGMKRAVPTYGYYVIVVLCALSAVHHVFRRSRCNILVTHCSFS